MKSHVLDGNLHCDESSISTSGNNHEFTDVVHDECVDTSGIVENLARNVGMAHGIKGEGYKIGLNVQHLSALIEFMRKVIETNELPYLIKRQVNRRACVFTSSKMESDMKRLPAFKELIFDGLALSPDLALFHRTYAAHPICQKHILFSAMTDEAVAEICNNFVMTLRFEGRRIGIKRRLANWKRNADENAKRLTRYLNTLHERYARLMVIRLDLMYRQAACQDAHEALQLHERLLQRNAKERMALLHDKTVDAADELPRVSIFVVTEDWRRLKDNMRGKPSLFRHLVGYVCSIEFSSIGGHHLHVALIFDGSQVKRHEWLGDQIGQYWVETTGGRGYFHNCNRGSYKNCGIGLIEHCDIEKRSHLMRGLMYLAKKDQFVRVKASPKSKTFMTGHMPKPPVGRTGRPRTKGVSMPAGASPGMNAEQGTLNA